MRIRRFDLVRYGKFTDQSMDLPAAEIDFHLIYGQNEAGKSTVRDAIVDLFYGIPRTSRYNFVHEYSEMCLGALIEANRDSLDFRRLKRNKSSLVDPAGGVLPESVLLPFLGGTDRGFFLRMFAIDHAAMVAGGQEILQSSGDLGQMLFQAAAGLGSFQSIKEKLDQEADGLWGPKAKGTRAYNQALQRMEAAKAELQKVRVTSNRWTAARRALDACNDELAKLDRQCAELSGLCERAERVKRISPLLAQLRDVQHRVEALGPVSRLPEGAASLLGACEIEIKEAMAQAQIHQRALEEAERDIAKFSAHAPVLDHAPEIRRLLGLVAKIQQTERDIPKREGEIAELNRRMLDTAAQIGWCDLSPDTIAGRLPSELVRAEIEDLIISHSTLVNAMERSTNELARARRELQSIDDESAALPKELEREALAATLRDAQSLNYDERAQELKAAIALAVRKLDEAMSELSPWSGEATRLAMARPLDRAEVQRLLELRERAEAVLGKCRQGLAERQLALSGFELEMEQARRGQRLATAEDLTAARTCRDDTFARIVSGEVSAQSASTEYAERVRQADILADRRYEEAERTARLQTLVNHCEKLRAELGLLQESEAGESRKLTELMGRWEAVCVASGVPGLSLERAISFIQQRSLALGAADALAVVRERHATFVARARACAMALQNELRQPTAPVPSVSELPTLVALAQRVLSESLQNRTRRELLAKRRSDVSATLESSWEDAARAKEAIQGWRERWLAKLELANLPDESTPVAVSKAMEVLRQLDILRAKIRDLKQERILPMLRDIEQFNVAVSALVAVAASELAREPVTAALAELGRRLEQAQVDRSEHQRLHGTIGKSRAQLDESTLKRSLAEAKLKPLVEQARVTTIEALREAVARSELALALDRSQRELRAAAIAGGGGMALDELEKEVESFHVPELGTKLDAWRRELAEVNRVRDDALQRRAVARSEYDRIAGTDEAAVAEARRLAALTEMGAAADEYVRVSTGARLLKWALERYREEKQGPLLTTASGYFARLTSGQHARLLVESGEPPRLISRRRDGSRVGVEQMSDGTSDQLYLALRLAALQLHVNGGHPMPFIADDLLINCDDQRAASSFAAFAGLARQTQVLYFTHHEHLVEIARSASEGKVNVVSLK
jgi:uncharacterized protein YhaN